MVRASLRDADPKTQTRRVANLADNVRVVDGIAKGYLPGCPQGFVIPCPYGKPGDRLWVRETHYILDMRPDVAAAPKARKPKSDCPIALSYLADDSTRYMDIPASEWRQSFDNDRINHRPSIHMPRWASRLTLEIVKVRVELLQEISDADAIAEGIERNCPSWNEPEKVKKCPACALSGICQARDEFIHDGLGECDFPVTAKEAFQYLWDSINSKREGGKYAWDKNPWVWVIQFRRVEAHVS